MYLLSQQPIDIVMGLREEQVTDMVKNLGFTGDRATQVNHPDIQSRAYHFFLYVMLGFLLKCH